LSCKAKKANIAKDTMDIFGMNFGYKPEIKAATPSILNTSAATKNRKYGKLQKEWEERNKYVKAATNERERLAIEKNWTSLQRKMADLEKDQVNYNKIPPLWIKETEECDAKFENFKKEMEKLMQSNTDKEQTIIKMQSIVAQVLENTREKSPDYVEKPTEMAYDKIDVQADMSTEIDNFKKNAKENEKDTINYKYIKPLLEDIGYYSKQRDLNELNSREENLKKKLNASTTEYEKKSINIDLAKLSTEKVKKLAEIKKIQDEFAIYTPEEQQKQPTTEDRKINYKKKVAEWENMVNERKTKINSLEEEKTIDEKKIKIASVNTEMDAKLKEIVELKKKLLLAKFYEGDYYGLSKSDRESYEKKGSKDRPLESVDFLNLTLKTAKDQYLEIAAKFSPYNKVQAEITLLNNDLTEFKTLKESWKTVRDAKDKEINEKNTSIGTIKKAAENNMIDNIRGALKPDEQAKVDNLNNQINVIQKEIDEKIIPFAEPANDNYNLYNKYIDELKKIKQKSTTIEAQEKELKDKFDPLKTASLKLIEDRKKAREEITETTVLDNKIKELNDAFNTQLKTLKLNLVGGGKILRRTRKYIRSRSRSRSRRRHYKKPSRYIVTKHKILKKSSRYRQRRRRKYTLRKN